MEQIEPYQIILLMAAVAYAAFLFGRATASHGGGEHQRLVEDEEIEAAMRSISAPKLEEVDRLIDNRTKIAAIKVVRAETGLGLKLAKMAVDRRAQQRGAR